MAGFNLQRRDAVKLLLAVAAGSAVNACGDSSKREATAPTEPSIFLTVSEMALLSTLAQNIIPTTDTPGAIEAGVPDTLQDLLTTWGDDTVRVHWRSGLESLSAYFTGIEGGGNFAELAAEKQAELLLAFDEAVYKGNIDNAFYKDFKQTIATAYYMSEAGATQELIYDPVPGEFKGCIPYSEVGRAWAT